MRVTEDGEIILSKRNLLTLLATLADDYQGSRTLMCVQGGKVVARVTTQTDQEHYVNRIPTPVHINGVWR